MIWCFSFRRLHNLHILMSQKIWIVQNGWLCQHSYHTLIHLYNPSEETPLRSAAASGVEKMRPAAEDSASAISPPLRSLRSVLVIHHQKRKKTYLYHPLSMQDTKALRRNSIRCYPRPVWMSPESRSHTQSWGLQMPATKSECWPWDRRMSQDVAGCRRMAGSQTE